MRLDEEALAKRLNLEAWKLIEKQGRTAEDTERMIHAAHASHYHWLQVGTNVNVVRGDYLISRAYACASRCEPALHHAQLCLDGCTANGLVDFDLAYAHEAMARALAACADESGFREHFRTAMELGRAIKNAEDKRIFESDLAAEPWFGLRYE